MKRPLPVGRESAGAVYELPPIEVRGNRGTLVLFALSSATVLLFLSRRMGWATVTGAAAVAWILWSNRRHAD